MQCRHYRAGHFQDEYGPGHCKRIADLPIELRVEIFKLAMPERFFRMETQERLHSILGTEPPPVQPWEQQRPQIQYYYSRYGAGFNYECEPERIHRSAYLDPFEYKQLCQLEAMYSLCDVIHGDAECIKHMNAFISGAPEPMDFIKIGKKLYSQELGDEGTTWSKTLVFELFPQEQLLSFRCRTPRSRKLTVEKHCGIQLFDAQVDAYTEWVEGVHFSYFANFFKTRAHQSPKHFMGLTRRLFMCLLDVAYRLPAEVEHVVILADMDIHTKNAEDTKFATYREGMGNNTEDMLCWRDMIELIQVLKYGKSPTSSYDGPHLLGHRTRTIEIIGQQAQVDLLHVEIGTPDPVLTPRIHERVDEACKTITKNFDQDRACKCPVSHTKGCQAEDE